jgi:hypothetical protein
MKVTSKRVVLLEMDKVDYEMLMDTLGEASKVRSKLYPSLNEKAALLYGSITAADMGDTFIRDISAKEFEIVEKGGQDSGTSNV